MNDQEEELARLCLELGDLRENVGQIMGILYVPEAKMDPHQVTVILETSGPTFESQPIRTVPSMWPSYGLPPDYSPPFEETHGVMQSTQYVISLLLFTEAHPVIHTATQLVVHPMV